MRKARPRKSVEFGQVLAGTKRSDFAGGAPHWVEDAILTLGSSLLA